MATVPVQQTFVAGADLLATQLNDDVRDAIRFLLDPPTFLGYLAADSARASGTGYSADVALTEEKDNDGMHSSTDAFITIQTQGRYWVCGWATIDTNSTGSRGVRVTKNGTSITVTRNRATEQGVWADDAAIEVDLEVGDVLAVSIFQNSGSSLNLQSGTNPFQTGLSARWVGLGD